MYGTGCIEDMERDFAETVRKCRRVTMESYKNEKLFMKIVGKVAKAVAPLL